MDRPADVDPMVQAILDRLEASRVPTHVFACTCGYTVQNEDGLVVQSWMEEHLKGCGDQPKGCVFCGEDHLKDPNLECGCACHIKPVPCDDRTTVRRAVVSPCWREHRDGWDIELWEAGATDMPQAFYHYPTYEAAATLVEGWIT